MCEWPALGTPWDTARSAAASAVRSRSGGAGTGERRSTGQGACGGCGFAGWWTFPEEEAALGNHSAPQGTEPCQCVSGQPWACHGALQGQIQLRQLRTEEGVSGPALGAAAGLGRWFVGVAVLPVCGDFQRRRQHSATTAHRALPVCEWPALGMVWGTAGSNAAPAVLSRSVWACTGDCGRAGQVFCGGCGFAGGLWRFPEQEAAISNYSAQSHASV